MVFYEKELKTLNKSKIKYLVVGGLAVNLHGLHRMTMDLDLMIDLSEENFAKFIEIMHHIGYETKVPKREWNKHSAIAFRTKEDEDKRIDIFLENPIDFDRAYKKRKVFSADKLRISCVGLDDLIAMKNKADRVRDWIDIGSLKRIQELKDKK
ncbi:nucleotidyltransferase [Candidatus Saganbacteria bacterium]|nr:nucleotidyltransferase [Candidatus Saganbacteria bacterium]